MLSALQAGASGYLLKRTPPGRILESISEVHQGGSPMSPDIARQVVPSFHQLRQTAPALAQLTAREEDLLRRLVAQGEHNKQSGSGSTSARNCTSAPVRRPWRSSSSRASRPRDRSSSSDAIRFDHEWTERGAAATQVAQTSSRRTVGRRNASSPVNRCRLGIGDTAGWKPAPQGSLGSLTLNYTRRHRAHPQRRIVRCPNESGLIAFRRG